MSHFLSRTSSFYPVIIISVVVLVLSFLFALSVGSVSIPLLDTYNSIFYEAELTRDQINKQIIWEIRFPRIIMALITGAGLAVTGAILQSVTRNPLADPYLFGISSGASLGAVLVMSAGSLFSIGSSSVTVGALIGASFSVVLMLTLAGKSAVQVEKLLLSGVAVSFMLSAFTSLVLYHSDTETAATLLFWMMGSFSNSQWQDLWLPSTVLLLGSSLFFIYRRWLDAIQAGDESAFTLGIPVNRLRLFMLIISAVITGVLVAHVGGIAFVGLMIPHIARFIIGTQIYKLIFMSLILGAIFMIWVDVIARSLFENQVLPIGIVTSAVGSIFFFIILKYRQN